MEQTLTEEVHILKCNDDSLKTDFKKPKFNHYL